MPPKIKPMPVRELKTLEPEKILDEILTHGLKAAPEEVDRGKDLIKLYIDQLLEGKTVAKSATRAISTRIAEIDQAISLQLNEILHNPEFQKLEASWRGLRQLVTGSVTGELLKIRVLNVSKRELLRDFQAASEFTESALWKKIYQSEFGQWGGDPFGALVGDYEFDRSAPDVELLDHVSKVAAAAHAPFISAASPQMFGMDNFTQMPNPRALEMIFDKTNPVNTKWLSFRKTDDSRFVALTLPHVLMRTPYGRENPVDAFDFREDVDGLEHDKYLWGNAAYAFANRLTDAFEKYHWCARIRGPEGGGLVSGLPSHVFRSREGKIGSKCPTEVLIPDTRDKELSDLGFVPLSHCKNTDYAAFFSANSTRIPQKFDKDAATANDKLSSQLEYLLVSSRIAHYLKAICRDKIGGFMSRQNCQDFLSRWINDYVLDMDDAPENFKAEKPLRQAEVKVVDDAARPGCYKAVMWLRPHFHLDELNVSLRLVADMPAAARKS